MNWKALKGKKRSKMNPLSIHMRKGRVAVFWVPGYCKELPFLP